MILAHREKIKLDKQKLENDKYRIEQKAQYIDSLQKKKEDRENQLREDAKDERNRNLQVRESIKVDAS